VSADHKTMKPVELIFRAIANHASEGETVLDMFGGSGSTLIAAQRANRRACLVELMPQYVDVTCRRFEEETGVTPILERTGKPRSFAKRR
jgi:site-specific DNA-methyltransferase (adenine-specific)